MCLYYPGGRDYVINLYSSKLPRKIWKIRKPWHDEIRPLFRVFQFNLKSCFIPPCQDFPIFCNFSEQIFRSAKSLIVVWNVLPICHLSFAMVLVEPSMSFQKKEFCFASTFMNSENVEVIVRVSSILNFEIEICHAGPRDNLKFSL